MRQTGDFMYLPPLPAVHKAPVIHVTSSTIVTRHSCCSSCCCCLSCYSSPSSSCCGSLGGDDGVCGSSSVYESHVTFTVAYGFESLMGLDRSHIHDVTLRNAPWYQAGLAREIALEILQQEEVGCFIVRDSSTHPGCYALSVRVPKFENSSGISHYLILRTHRGVKLKGLDKEWSNLNALVTHHTVMREMLPCTLRLPKTSATVSQDASQPGKEESKGENLSHISSGLKPTKK